MNEGLHLPKLSSNIKPGKKNFLKATLTKDLVHKLEEQRSFKVLGTDH